MKFLKYFYLVFILVIVILAVIFFKNNLNEIIETIRKVSFFDFLILSTLTIITIILNGNKIEILTRYYNLKLKFKEWFGLSAITTMSNYLAPFGLGMSLRGIYLKKKHNFSYKLFLTTLATSYLTSFLLYSLVGILIILYAYLKYNFFNLLISLIFIITFIACLAIIIFSPKIRYSKNKYVNHFIWIINNWNKMKKNWRLLIKLSLNDFFSLLNYSIRIFFIFYILSNKISFTSGILISLLTLFSLIIGLTPASIGVKEALIVYSTTVIGKSINLGILVAAIDRGVSIVYVFILGGIFSYLLLKNLRNN